MWASAVAIALKFLPSIAGAVASVINKAKDVTISAYTTTANVATAQAEYMTAVLGHPLSAPSILCYSVALYYGKAIAYDNVISYWLTGRYGNTPELIPSTAYIAMIIISGMFFSGIAGIIKRS